MKTPPSEVTKERKPEPNVTPEAYSESCVRLVCQHLEARMVLDNVNALRRQNKTNTIYSPVSSGQFFCSLKNRNLHLHVNIDVSRVVYSD